MGIELINLSNETKAYLNNLRKAIEKQAAATERLARAIEKTLPKEDEKEKGEDKEA